MRWDHRRVNVSKQANIRCSRWIPSEGTLVDCLGPKPTHSEPANDPQPASLPSNTTKLKSAEPLHMPNLLEFTCERCSMTFPTDEALYKHRTRFCTVGKDADNSTRSLYPTNGVSHSSPSEKVRLTRVTEFSSGVSCRVETRRGSRMEESTDPSSNGARHGRSDSPRFAKDTETSIRSEETNAQLQRDSSRSEWNMPTRSRRGNLRLQYDRLQAQERDVIREMFNLQSQPMSHVRRRSVCFSSLLIFSLCFSRKFHRWISQTIRQSN